MIEGLRQLAGHPAAIDAVMAEDFREIGVGRLQELDQPVLDLDVVIGARQAHTRGAFERPPAGVVQFGHQGFWT